MRNVFTLLLLSLALISRATVFSIHGEEMRDTEKGYVRMALSDFENANKEEVAQLLAMNFFDQKAKQSPELDRIIGKMMESDTNIAISLSGSNASMVHIIRDYTVLCQHLYELGKITRRKIRALGFIIDYYVDYLAPKDEIWKKYMQSCGYLSKGDDQLDNISNSC